jgi:hypothetical protein
LHGTFLVLLQPHLDPHFQPQRLPPRLWLGMQSREQEVDEKHLVIGVICASHISKSAQ